MAKDQPQGFVTERYEFYRDGFRRSMQINRWMGIGLAAAIAVIIGLIVIRPAPKYFPTGQGCSLLPMVPLDERSLNDNEVMNFAVAGATQAYTVRHDTWRTDLERVHRYFDKEGWESFIEGLEAQQFIKFIESGKIITRGFVTDKPPIITKRGKDPQSKVYTWVVELPMVVAFEGPNDPKSQKLLAKITLVRMPSLENPEGIGIHQITTQTYADAP